MMSSGIVILCQLVSSPPDPLKEESGPHISSNRRHPRIIAAPKSAAKTKIVAVAFGWRKELFLGVLISDMCSLVPRPPQRRKGAFFLGGSGYETSASGVSMMSL